jgi:hypothetical protein
LVVEESEQGATSREVVLNFQKEAFGFPDDHHRRSRIQDSLCCRRRRSSFLSPPSASSTSAAVVTSDFFCSFFLGSFCVLTDFGFLGLLIVGDTSLQL